MRTSGLAEIQQEASRGILAQAKAEMPGKEPASGQSVRYRGYRAARKRLHPRPTFPEKVRQTSNRSDDIRPSQSCNSGLLSCWQVFGLADHARISLKFALYLLAVASQPCETHLGLASAQ